MNVACRGTLSLLMYVKNFISSFISYFTVEVTKYFPNLFLSSRLK
jgi:hypothetical protein